MQSEDNTVRKLEFKDGDGGGEPTPEVANWKIDIVGNGFIITTTFDNDEEYTEVCYTIDELLTIVESSFKGG